MSESNPPKSPIIRFFWIARGVPAWRYLVFFLTWAIFAPIIIGIGGILAAYALGISDKNSGLFVFGLVIVVLLSVIGSVQKLLTHSRSGK